MVIVQSDDAKVKLPVNEFSKHESSLNVASYANIVLEGLHKSSSLADFLNGPLSWWVRSDHSNIAGIAELISGKWHVHHQVTRGGNTTGNPNHEVPWLGANKALETRASVRQTPWTFVPLTFAQLQPIPIPDRSIRPLPLAAEVTPSFNQNLHGTSAAHTSTHHPKPTSLTWQHSNAYAATTASAWSVPGEWIFFSDVYRVRSGPQSSLTEDSVQGLVNCLANGISIWQAVQSKSRDVQRMTQILSVAADWHTHLDLDRLLESIAMAATKLLCGDRASIFLWDKAAHELVGHPALGIEGKPLRIPDNAGLAGTVLRTLEPRRWDRSDPSDEVNRRIDKSFGYRTDSLVAVPLFDPRGKAMGVFEVLNHRQGRFSSEDQRDLIELAKHASAALSNTQQINRLLETRDRLIQDAINQVQLIGDSPEMQSLKSTVARVGDTDLAVLLLGENGTGKEVVSRQIHYQSRRRHEPFIAVNCAAITETLLESELFGHEKGAFTDAHETRVGKFELAHGGSLFLDEIGDMSLAGQAKLLRVLEEKVVVRVGGSTAIPVQVRVIAATNQNLVSLVQAKRFREDLYFRLTVVTLNLPPLRDRRDDILTLADFFMNMFCKKIGRAKPEWSAGAKRRLLSHSWPGNVRELRNLVERLAYLTVEEVINESQVDFVRSPRSDRSESDEHDLTQTLAEATDNFQTTFIEQHILAAGKNITQAAENLGLQRSNLYRKMKQLGMKPPD